MPVANDTAVQAPVDALQMHAQIADAPPRDTAQRHARSGRRGPRAVAREERHEGFDVHTLALLRAVALWRASTGRVFLFAGVCRESSRHVPCACSTRPCRHASQSAHDGPSSRVSAAHVSRLSRLTSNLGRKEARRQRGPRGRTLLATPRAARRFWSGRDVAAGSNRWLNGISDEAVLNTGYWLRIRLRWVYIRACVYHSHPACPAGSPTRLDPHSFVRSAADVRVRRRRVFPRPPSRSGPDRGGACVRVCVGCTRTHTRLRFSSIARPTSAVSSAARGIPRAGADTHFLHLRFAIGECIYEITRPERTRHSIRAPISRRRRERDPVESAGLSEPVGHAITTKLHNSVELGSDLGKHGRASEFASKSQVREQGTLSCPSPPFGCSGTGTQAKPGSSRPPFALPHSPRGHGTICTYLYDGAARPRTRGSQRVR
ncbi:hypothetical protein EIP86_007903 [Pleurotus ostreatoroseus]|nr:hypothetical protein EIP86_007903 [Pleurotus ostreatoroseus]